MKRLVNLSLVLTLLALLAHDAAAQCTTFTANGTATTTTCTNVGIGAPNPATSLHIIKSATAAIGPEIRLENSANAVNDMSAVTFAANLVPRAQVRSRVEGTSGWPGTIEFLTGYNTLKEAMRINGAGYVGIGTPSPEAPLDVNGHFRVRGPTVGTELRPASMEWSVSPGGQSNRWIAFAGSPTGSIGVVANAFELYEYPPNATPSFAAVRMSIRKSTIAAPKTLYLMGDGSMGIGQQPTSNEALVVSGNVRATGNISADGAINAKYQDLAEWVPSDEDLQPGTVVVLSRSGANRVTTSSTPYDTRVAGVVSAQPGILLGEAGADKEQVATTGRVRVRVDASAGPVEIGDLLVTSAKPGYAMKSIPVELSGLSMHRPGTIIGKALEPLTSPEGEILVLLSLQ